MIIKMVNEFKLTVVHFACPNPMQICACVWIYRWTKKLWKIRTGPRGRHGPLGRRGPLGRGPAFSKTPLLSHPQSLFQTSHSTCAKSNAHKLEH